MNSLQAVAHGRLRREPGFSLIELLVVVLVIGVLAAIAIPAFLGQRQTAQDAEAKSLVRDLQRMVDECKVEPGKNYTGCDTAAELDGAPGLTFGTGPGQVGIIATADVYWIWAVSHAKTGDSSHVYVIYAESPGKKSRLCFTDSGNSDGGCDNGEW